MIITPWAASEAVLTNAGFLPPADNGPLTSPNEGLSFITFEDGAETRTMLLRDAVSELRAELIGERLWKQYERWPMYSKFFDNQGPLPHHIHHRDEHAKLTGQMGKPEAYFTTREISPARSSA